MAKIPDFKTEKEEAEFWDSHDITDFLDELTEVNVDIEATQELKAAIKERYRHCNDN